MFLLITLPLKKMPCFSAQSKTHLMQIENERLHCAKKHGPLPNISGSVAGISGYDG
jgi:hypothetical protein